MGLACNEETSKPYQFSAQLTKELLEPTEGCLGKDRAVSGHLSKPKIKKRRKEGREEGRNERKKWENKRK